MQHVDSVAQKTGKHASIFSYIAQALKQISVARAADARAAQDTFRGYKLRLFSFFRSSIDQSFPMVYIVMHMLRPLKDKLIRDWKTKLFQSSIARARVLMCFQMHRRATCTFVCSIRAL